MPKPWEAPAAPQGGKPWETAESHGLMEHKAAPRAASVEEMHPDISVKDRLIVENFGNDPESSLKYLRDKYPKLQFGMVGDRIGVLGKGESQFRFVNPDMSFSNELLNPKELGLDIAGQGANIAKGVGSTVASGVGGLAGAPLGGVGALGGAAAAGGAANAGGEYLRQQIGRALGVNEEIKGGPIAVDAATGAAAPLLFGTGATAAQIAKAGVNPATQAGLAGKAYNAVAQKVLPKVGEAVSGVPQETIKYAANNLDKIKELEKKGVLDFATDAHESIVQPIQDAKLKIGQDIQKKIESAQIPVDVTEAQKPFQDLLAKLKAQQVKLNTPEVQQKLDDVGEAIKHYLTEKPPTT